MGALLLKSSLKGEKAGAFSVLVGAECDGFWCHICIPIRTLAGELSVPGWGIGLQLAGGTFSSPAPPSAG